MLIAASIDGIHEVETYVIAVLTLIGSAAVAATAAVMAIKKLTREIEGIWEFVRLRGRQKAANAGLILNTEEPTVPDALRADLRTAYEPVAATLRELRAKYATLNDAQFVAKISKHLGAWLVRYICGPHKVDSGECLEMARIVAGEPPRAPRPDSDSIAPP